jgi:hypothetical protein
MVGRVRGASALSLSNTRNVAKLTSKISSSSITCWAIGADVAGF